MNYADFDTQPNGFPLESDATLGFVQRNFQEALENGLAKILGPGSWILDGVVVTGGVASDGWVYHNGEILFFQGGSVSANFIIDENVVQKANEDSTLIDRYFTRFCRFGTGAGQTAFDSLKRWNGVANLTLVNSWATTGAAVVKRQGQVATVQVFITTLGTSSTWALVLPEEYRPDTIQTFWVLCYRANASVVAGHVLVDTDGRVYVNYPIGDNVANIALNFTYRI